MDSTLKDLPLWRLTALETASDKMQGERAHDLIKAVREEWALREDELGGSPLKAPVAIDGYAVIVQTLTTPEDNEIPIYTFSDKSGRLFVDAQRLAVATHYPYPDCVTSVASEFYSCLNLSAGFYKVTAPPRVVQNKLFIDVQDVPQFLNNCIRYLADEYEEYVVIKDLADFWSTADFRYTVKSSTEPTEKQLVDKFSEYFDIPRDRVKQFILDHKDAEFKRHRAELKDLIH